MITTSAARPCLTRISDRRLSLGENVVWTLIGNGGYALSQWAILIAIARAGDLNAVGQFALALAVTAPVFVASNLQLRSVQSADVTQQFSFGDFLGLRIVAATTGVVIVGLIGVMYEWSLWLPIALMGIAKAVECVIDIISGVFQSRERMDLATRSMLLRGFGSLVAVLACTWFSRNVAVFIAALLIARLVALISYDLPLCRNYVSDMVPEVDWRRIGALAKLTWPLGLVTMIGSINVNIPRYQIDRTLGTADLGIFSALSYVLVLASMMANAVGQSATPRLAAAFSAGDRRHFIALTCKLCMCVTAVGVGVVLATACAGPQLLTSLYGPEYAKQSEVLIALAVAMAISLPASIVNCSIVPMRSFTIQIPIVAITAAVTCAVAMWLIPGAGLIGAAIALASGSLMQLVLASAVLIRVLLLKPVLVI